MKNGEIAKGYSSDFSPDEESFHLISITDPLYKEEIAFDNLKAVFFVKDFKGDFLHMDTFDFSKAPVNGKHIIISFFDGEIIFATAKNLHDHKTGFFVYPVDPETNTERAFVINSFINSVEMTN
jgi:hypothetical protein